MSFLPEGYTVPDKTNGYFKFKIGENRFRILSRPVLGYEWWVSDGKGNKQPRRVPMGTPVPVEEVESENDPRHFWAMVVWNRDEQRVQVLEITQKGIQRSIRSLTQNKEWGDPTAYDISVIRTGEGMETEYEVIPSPHRELEEEVKKAYAEAKVRLEALFDGSDPFQGSADAEVDAIDEALSEAPIVNAKGEQAPF